jgi:rod shape-determining protein MreD
VLGVTSMILGAVALQMALARFTVGGQWAMDIVLVAVAFVALKWGAGAGITGGALGGLLQDSLAGGIVGIGGLAKTIIGFAIGVTGSQFIVSRAMSRVLVVAVASIVNRTLVTAIISATELKWAHVSPAAMLTEMVLNAVVAFIVFQSVESVPAMARRRPTRRSAFGTRKW